MARCQEICPIAKPPAERVLDTNGDPTITSVANGVTVTALESAEYPGVTAAQVPPDATPTCDLPARIANWRNKIGIEGGTGHCSYVPGKVVWLSVENNPSQT